MIHLIWSKRYNRKLAANTVGDLEFIDTVASLQRSTTDAFLEFRYRRELAAKY
jgi:hypothetical protein